MKSLVLIVALVLTGCATVDPATQAAQDANAAMQVTCDNAEDCELKWARALQWVQENSRWKLRNVTDSLITTEGPLSTPSPAYEVTKFPLGGGRYEIRFRAGCGNIFGCVPSIKEVTASFNAFVAYGM